MAVVRRFHHRVCFMWWRADLLSSRGTNNRQFVDVQSSLDMYQPRPYLDTQAIGQSVSKQASA